MHKYRIIIFLLICALIFWLPFIILKKSSTATVVQSLKDLPDSDAVIIFGTIVDVKRAVSPLLRERLEAGIQILEKGKAKKIVVSNMETASEVMADYLYRRGIRPDMVEIDPDADDTPDTCRFERKHHAANRKVIFISQGFHLPRLIYQCGKTGITGTSFPAENINITDREADDFFTRIYIRCTRYIREAGLTWLAVLNIYT